jgi:hypothetical protein
MSILNRRNAVAGWLTWAIAKKVIRRTAKAKLVRAEAVVPGLHAAEPTQKRRRRRVLAFLTALGIGVASYVGSRVGRGRDEPGP